MTRRKILFVIGSLERGGAELHLLRIAPQLDFERFEVSFFLFGRRGAAAEEVPRHIQVVAPWIEMPDSDPGVLKRLVRFVGSSVQFAYYLLRKQPDVVHFFLPSSYIHGAVIARLLGCRNLVMSRRSLNNYMKARPGWVNWLEMRLHRHMSAITGNSRAVVRQLTREEGAPADRTFLVYNGVTVPEYSAETRRVAREALGVRQDEIVLVVLANLHPYKGHADLLHACALLPVDLPWRLVVVGRDAAGILSELTDIGTRLGIWQKVSMVGSQTDVAKFLAGADIGVLPSHEEGFSNAILESMAFGLAMIVTDVGGNAEAVVHGKTGLVVPARSPLALSAGIRQLIENAEQRRQMGEAGRRRVQESFSWDRCVERYHLLYDAVLTARSRNVGAEKAS